MYLENLTKTIDRMNQIKVEKDFSQTSFAVFSELPTLNGVCELQFKDSFFYMLNIGEPKGLV